MAQTSAELDCLSANGFSDGGPFTLGVAGHVYAPADGDGPSCHRLGEAALSLADDASEEAIRIGDDAVLVQHSRVEAEPST